MLLAGFNSLDEAAVRAAAATEDTAWWFFLAEHFTEPRFGLDVENQVTSQPLDWNDASWSAAKSGQETDSPGRASRRPLRRPASTMGGKSYTWAANGASTGWTPFKFPFRRGMRRRYLLPPAGGEGTSPARFITAPVLHEGPVLPISQQPIGQALPVERCTRAEVRHPIGGIVTNGSGHVIDGLNTATPITMLPLRLETRFAGTSASPQPLVRIYPDDVHIDQFDPRLDARRGARTGVATGATSAPASTPSRPGRNC